MIKIAKSVRDYLISKTEISNIAKKVFLNWYPEDLKDTDFPFILIICEGKPDAEDNVIEAQIETRCYVKRQEDDVIASNLDDKIFEVLTGRNTELDIYSNEIEPYGFDYFDCVNKGQYFEDPDLKWVYYLSTYTAIFNL